MPSTIRQLAEIVQDLPSGAAAALLEFTQFLQSKYSAPSEEHSPEPITIDRPDSETVVHAIKRLSATYPMIDKDEVFAQTSQVMSAHLIAKSL